MVHTPVRASGLTQVEIYFSVVQRKVVPANGFTDLVQAGSQHSKTATTPRHSRSKGSSPSPTWTIHWPDFTGTPPITWKKSPPSPLHDQPPKG
ncbi:hypothetical protein [Streptomyces sp. NPDC056682]|uniref:hypothetical protein n=1 Tax=Streptomyces sp. NPDC056682 TaxID=3345909 RepID=UPI0036976B37